jgi:formylmethanofuran dehydrogenase subunit E
MMGGLDMKVAEALRSIRHDWLSYIQETVDVDFDNDRQVPVHFTYRAQRRLILDVLSPFRIRDGNRLNGFLIKADDGEVYFLYFQVREQGCGIRAGKWVLSFRVLGDNELLSFYRGSREMLVNMTVKRVVDFHGHLCPDLVIGMKACEYAQELLFEGGAPSGRISVIAENCTSALDAIQVLLGVTLGNQSLKVYNFGKHNYTFAANSTSKGFTLQFKGWEPEDLAEYGSLEEKVVRNRITLDEVVRLQQLTDDRVRTLLAAAPKDLFQVDGNSHGIVNLELPSIYLTCADCGQQVLRDRAVKFGGETYCVPCLDLVQSHHPACGLH